MTRRGIFWLVIALAFVTFIYLINNILLPFVLGIFIAYFLSPVADRIQRIGASRGVASFIVLGLFFTGLTLLLLLVVPVVASQLSGLLAALPGYLNDFLARYEPVMQQWLGLEISEDAGLQQNLQSNIQSTLTGHSGTMLRLAAGFVAGLFQSGMAIINFFSLILVTPIVAFYLLHDWHRIIHRTDALLPRQHVHTIREQIRIIDRTLSGFVRGQLNVCLLLGTFYALGLSLVGLRFGIIIGLATGLLVIIPYVGMFFGMAVGLGVAFFQFDDTHKLLMVLGVFVLGQIIEGNFITPKLVGEKVGLHPVWIIFGMLSGAALFGFVGVLLAVPVTAVIGVLIRFAAQKYLHSSYYQGESPPLIQS